MKQSKKEHHQFSDNHPVWYPIFSDEEIIDLLCKLKEINPGHPFIVDCMLIGKN